MILALPRVILALMGVKMAVPATVGKYMPLVTVRLAHIVTNVKISDVSLQLNIYFHYLLLQLLLFSFFVFLCVTRLNISEVSLLELKVSGTAYTSIIYYYNYCCWCCCYKCENKRSESTIKTPWSNIYFHYLLLQLLLLLLLLQV